jgi:hypothetical protein
VAAVTAVERATLFLFVLVFVWAIFQGFVNRLRCRYCGRVNTHEDHCPYAGSGLHG